MKFLNNIQYHEWEDMLRGQRVVRAVLTFNAQMTVSDALLQSSGKREVHIRTRKLLAEQIQTGLFGEVVTELAELRREMFTINDPSVIPVLDRVSNLIDKLRRGQP